MADEKEKENEDDEVEDEAVTEQRRIEMVRKLAVFDVFFSLPPFTFALFPFGSDDKTKNSSFWTAHLAGGNPVFAGGDKNLFLA